MRIELLTPQDDDALTGFLNQVGASSHGAAVLGYHYPVYREMLLAALGEGVEPAYLAARRVDSSEWLAVLPGFVKTVGDQSCYNSMPYFGPNAGVLSPIEAADTRQQIELELLRAALTLAKNKNALTAVFYSAFNPFSERSANPPPPEFSRPIEIERETLFIKLPEHGPIQWKSKIPYDLRKAEKAGITVSSEIAETDIETIYRLYHENCTDHGIPVKPFNAVEFLLRRANHVPQIKAHVARQDGKIIAALIVMRGPQTASYYLPCTASTHRTLQPGSLLIDFACHQAIADGVRYWNWEASPSSESGVYQFKKKWGAQSGSYTTTVYPLASADQLATLTSEEIAKNFPFFYVYPFNQLPRGISEPPRLSA